VYLKAPKRVDEVGGHVGSTEDQGATNRAIDSNPRPESCNHKLCVVQTSSSSGVAPTFSEWPGESRSSADWIWVWWLTSVRTSVRVGKLANPADPGPGSKAEKGVDGRESTSNV